MTPLNLLETFLGSLCGTAAKIFFEKSSAPWSVAADDKLATVPAGTKLLSLKLLAENPRAEAVIQLSLENAALLAIEITGTAGISPSQLRAEHVEAIRESFAKACKAALMQRIPGAQAQVSLTKGQPTWATAKQVSLTASNSASGKIEFQLLFSQEWLKPIPSTTAPPQDCPAHHAASQGSTANIDIALLKGVELNAMLRFGQRQLTLRQVSELTAGSVVELDKQVQEPAELLLGDRVIARGEVVIVDGSYGLRVTELP